MSNQTREYIAGATVFFSMSYVMFANAAVLSSVGIPAGAVFVATCLAAGIGSIVVGLYGNTPTAVAPAMGLSIFFASFVKAPGLDWHTALCTSALASLAFVAATGLGWRRKIAENLPESIKIALSSGIGAILANFAIETFLTTKGCDVAIQNICPRKIEWPLFQLFLIGLAIIYIFQVVIKNRALSIRSQFLLFVSSLGFLCSVVVVWSLAKLTAPETFGATIGSGSMVVTPLSGVSLADYSNPQKFPIHLILFLFVLYVLLSDVVGTALDEKLLPLSAQDRDRRVDSSLAADSWVAFASTMIGTTPTVSYGENHVARMTIGEQAQGTPDLSGRVAIVVGAGFLLSLIIGLLSYYVLGRIPVLLPSIVIAPTLFFVGLYIIAESFVDVERKPPGTDNNQRESLRRRYIYWIPGATAVTLMAVMPIEIALGLSILSYYFYGLAKQENNYENIWLIGLAVLAFLAVVLSVIYQVG
ncbi:MAG: hypothetical protein ACK4MF_07495 [Hyphomicrobiaceae bacterium]